MFLMSPYSAKRSVKSSSEASSWMFVAMTIQPSMLRTATALVDVRASPPEVALGSPFLGSVDERGGSMSISVDIFVGIEGWCGGTVWNKYHVLGVETFEVSSTRSVNHSGSLRCEVDCRLCA
jgi:hypothetical protein